MEQDVKLLLARVEDALRLCTLRSSPKFLGFLTPAEQTAVITKFKNDGIVFFGGYEDAERRMLGALPDYITDQAEAFPLVALRFVYRAADSLAHRDILGSLMATGITRDCIGDIRIAQGVAVAYVTAEIADYLAEQITKIGRVGVRAQAVSVFSVEDDFPPPQRLPVTFTVASPRLDAVVSGLLGCGRNAAEELIADGMVFVNSFATLKAIQQIKVGDKITVRGRGKFTILQMGHHSKKGREIISAEKYI